MKKKRSVFYVFLLPVLAGIGSTAASVTGAVVSAGTLGSVISAGTTAVGGAIGTATAGAATAIGAGTATAATLGHIAADTTTAVLNVKVIDEKEKFIMKNKSNHFITAGVAGKTGKHAIKQAVKGINSFEQASNGLSSLNTMRGGVKGFKGFVAEEMEAAEASSLGRSTAVLNNNGIADLAHTKTDGTVVLKQMKVGYKPGQIDFARYKGQTLVVDKGNPHIALMKSEGAKYGVKVVEGHVSNNEAKLLADAMQMETKITGSKNAVIAPKVYQGVKSASAAHGAGVSAAKNGAAFGGGFSIGKNAVKVLKGDKSIGEAAEDVAVDTVIAGATGYGVGAAGSLIGSTVAGAAAIETVGTIGTAIASAPVIGSVVGAGTTAAALVGSAGTAAAASAAGLATGAVSAAATAASSVAAGTIGAGLVSSVGAGAIAATAAAGAAAVAAAPVVAVGAVIGGIISWFSD